MHSTGFGTAPAGRQDVLPPPMLCCASVKGEDGAGAAGHAHGHVVQEIPRVGVQGRPSRGMCLRFRRRRKSPPRPQLHAAPGAPGLMRGLLLDPRLLLGQAGIAPRRCRLRLHRSMPW